jgi:hypothetical protein
VTTATRNHARGLYADALAAQGPALANTANSVRSGFENFWVAPALDAIEGLLRRCPDEGEDD